MQLSLTDIGCNGVNQLVVNQDQGDNTPIILQFPYDVTDYVFTGTINFPVPVHLSLGTGITIDDIISCTGSINDNTLTISAITNGTIYVGMTVNGLNIIPGTYITGFGTGSGGVGTYTISVAQIVESTAIVCSKVIMQLTSAQTQNVPEGQYPFDLWTTDLANVNSDPLTGYFSINNAITVIS